MAVTAVIAYDVTDDRRRARLAALLQAHGDRIQKSVFVLTVEEDTLREVASRAAATLDLGEDSVYVFRQCRTCWSAVELVGQAFPPSQELFFAVW